MFLGLQAPLFCSDSAKMKCSCPDVITPDLHRTEKLLVYNWDEKLQRKRCSVILHWAYNIWISIIQLLAEIFSKAYELQQFSKYTKGTFQTPGWHSLDHYLSYQANSKGNFIFQAWTCRSRLRFFIDVFKNNQTAWGKKQH